MRIVRTCCIILAVAVVGFGATYIRSTYFLSDRYSILIKQLVNVDQPDTGYSPSFGGSNFLPYGDTENIGVLILGATAGEHSPVMREIVESGYDAVPALLNHLGDSRITKIPSAQVMWTDYSNEYDYNQATAVQVPQGVNLERSTPSDRMHQTTVGDLCFVALGQIVNRQWSSCRYAPSMGQAVSSPSYSWDLRRAIRKEWGGLDRAGHRAKLIEDFRRPDHKDRLIGAYQRLSFYYPEEVEPLVLELISPLIANGSADNAKFRDDLNYSEQNSASSDMASIVKSLTHDESVAIGNAVKGIMESDAFKQDLTIIEGCLMCLASRPSYGGYLADRLKQVDFASVTAKEFPNIHLAAIATSKSPAVQAELRKVIELSSDPDLFFIAAKTATEDSWSLVIDRAKVILGRLPADTTHGRELLSLILHKAPQEAESILTDFLNANAPVRCNTVCNVLWYNQPISQRVLLRFLDDQRMIPGLTENVRSRAARVIDHSIESIEYNPDWPEEKREEAIRKIKEYCQQNRTITP